jgi:hypothetical protein
MAVLILFIVPVKYINIKQKNYKAVRAILGKHYQSIEYKPLNEL